MEEKMAEGSEQNSEAGTESANVTSLEVNPNLDAIVFALLFSSDEPLSVRKIAAIIEDSTGDAVRASLERWRVRLDDEGWSIRVEHVGGGYHLASRPDYAPYISRMYTGKRKLRLSRASLETLAVIAYKQPVTRGEVEIVRGVGCGGVIGTLMERSLIKITGKAKVLGAPFLYGTTPEFLEYLGLNSIRDLPSMEELEQLLEREAGAEAAEIAHAHAARDAEDAEDAVDMDAEVAAVVAAVDRADEARAVLREGTRAAASVAEGFDPKPDRRGDRADDGEAIGAAVAGDGESDSDSDSRVEADDRED